MKIGIDIRAACGSKRGKGWYTYHLVKKLLELDSNNEYLLYTDTIARDVGHIVSNAKSAAHIHIKVIKRNPLLWHFAVILDFVKSRGDLFFAPTSFIIPAFLPRRIKSIMTVHDLVAFLHPQLHETKATILERLFFPIALRKAYSVLVPSENTKKDLMRLFRYPEKKITVTPLGVESIRHNEFKKIKEKYKLPENYILTVSGLEPRKNVRMLIDAALPLPLVIVGGKGWKSKATQEKLRKAESHIVHIENCDSADLPLIYARAKLFVFPSFYEGFGLPPLEAMAAGCPVVCSNAASLPEIVGDCALLFDPHSPQELNTQIEKILSDEKLCEDLSSCGKKHAAQSTWQRTAGKTLAAFRACAQA